eukprot:9481118-Pyramimonas_sp.AAC.1
MGGRARGLGVPRGTHRATGTGGPRARGWPGYRGNEGRSRPPSGHTGSTEAQCRRSHCRLPEAREDCDALPCSWAV